MTLTAQVLQVHIKAVRHTEFGNRRQRKAEHNRVFPAHQCTVSAGCNRLSLLLGFRTFAPVFKFDKGHRRVLTHTGQAKADYRHHRFNGIFLIVEHVILHAFYNRKNLLSG